MRSLFAPGAPLKAIGPKGLRGGVARGLHRRKRPRSSRRKASPSASSAAATEVWGGLATVWSAYDGRTANGSFHERGINSFQLVKIDGKWLVASILWQEETPGRFPLPANLTRGSKK